MRKIKLGNINKYVLVDDSDYDRLNKTIWTYSKTGKTEYVVRVGTHRNKIKRILIHRQIMGVLDHPKEIEVDHINHNRLDNQKSNLRLCSRQQNCSNYTRVFKDKKNKFKGVEYRKGRSKPWVAYKHFCGKRIHLGYFKTEKEAAVAFNKKSLELNGEFAVLNRI